MEKERKGTLNLVTNNIERVLKQIQKDVEDNPLAPQYVHSIKLIAELMPTAILMLGALNDKFDTLSDVLASTISSNTIEEDEIIEEDEE